MTGRQFTDHDTWFAQLPGVVVAARVLIAVAVAGRLPAEFAAPKDERRHSHAAHRPGELSGGQQQRVVVVAAGALITDPAGRVLIVKPNYRDHWTLPGGVCEQGEPPHAGCAREVEEEVGLVLPPGALLAVDWSQPYGLGARPIMHFVFDGGTVSESTRIVVQEEELDSCRAAGERGPVALRSASSARAICRACSSTWRRASSPYRC